MNQNNPFEISLTDLHTHILPAVDDGAEDLQIALKMLCAEKKLGVERIVLTPHFYPMREKLDAFVNRRREAYAELQSGWVEGTMPQIRLGAEVRYTPQLTQMDLRQLTIENSNYLLLELPDTDAAPYVKQVVEIMLMQGITPILAHVERCAAFRNQPNRLTELIEMGALAQVDVCALTHRRSSQFVNACLSNGLVHIIASDIHNLTDRAVSLGSIATSKYLEILKWTEEFARAVWDNTPPPAFSVHAVRKGLLGYR